MLHPAGYFGHSEPHPPVSRLLEQCSRARSNSPPTIALRRRFGRRTTRSSAPSPFAPIRRIDSSSLPLGSTTSTRHASPPSHRHDRQSCGERQCLRRGCLSDRGDRVAGRKFIPAIPRTPHRTIGRPAYRLHRRRHLLEEAVPHDRQPPAQGHGLFLVVSDIDDRGPEPAVQSRQLGSGLTRSFASRLGSGSSNRNTFGPGRSPGPAPPAARPPESCAGRRPAPAPGQAPEDASFTRGR